MKGKVKRFSDYRGYGFITGEDNQDYFVHYNMIIGAGYKTLEIGEDVAFEPYSSDRGLQAHSVITADYKWVSQNPPKQLKLNPFTPQDPIIDPNKFAGRSETLVNAIDCIFNNKNLLITGARGVGKSSVAYQMVNMTRGDRTLIEKIGIDTCGFEFNHITGDHRCLPGDNLQSISKGLINSLKIREDMTTSSLFSKKTIQEWNFKIFKSSEEIQQNLLTSDEISLEFVVITERILKEVKNPKTGICFLIDEVDVVDNTVPLASFLKSIIEKLRMDQFPNIFFILCGVTGSTTDLIAQHPSASRLTETYCLESMNSQELSAIVDQALSSTDVSIEHCAKELIIQLSGGFPAPIHLLGYHAFRLNNDKNIDSNDVKSARDFIVQKLKNQEFQGRLERIKKDSAAEILKFLAQGPHSDTEISKKFINNKRKTFGIIGNLVHDSYVIKRGQEYSIAEPLFNIYLRWIFGIPIE